MTIILHLARFNNFPRSNVETQMTSSKQNSLVNLASTKFKLQEAMKSLIFSSKSNHPEHSARVCECNTLRHIMP